MKVQRASTLCVCVCVWSKPAVGKGGRGLFDVKFKDKIRKIDLKYTSQVRNVIVGHKDWDNLVQCLSALV